MAEAGLLNVGDIFGEESLHNQAPYEFDVVAQGSVSFLVISRDSIEQLCGPMVDIVSRSAGGAASNTDLQKEISSMTERLTIEGEFRFIADFPLSSLKDVLAFLFRPS
jgi:CRP-like cAMP-binding protein